MQRMTGWVRHDVSTYGADVHQGNKSAQMNRVSENVVDNVRQEDKG